MASCVGAEFVRRLLAPPTPEDWARLLEREGLLHRDGLDRLLDTADRLINDDPGMARRLAELAEQVAEDAGAPAAVPRARYIRAGAHGTNGEFREELRLIGEAREGYLALGERLEALRTDVGLMVALIELGRYREALQTGRGVLDALAGRGALDVAPTPEQADLLTALVDQNLGICYEYMGRYGEALAAYAAAEDRYQTLGMAERLGEIGMNRGAVLMYLGRGREALEAHEAAATVFREADLTLSHARALGNVGETLLYLGDYTGSLGAFERARRLLGSLDASADEGGLLLDTAKAYLQLNLYSEALSAYAELNGRLRDAGIEHDRAEVLWGMGSALVALSDFGEAERALRGAADKFSAAGNAPMLSGVLLEQASLLAARGDRERALATARRALALLSEEDWPVQLVYAHLRLFDLLLPKDEGEAERHLLEARRLAERLTVPHLLYRLADRLGHLRRLQGREEEAEALLEAAVAEIERLRGTVSGETMRASFLRDKTAAYEDLILLHLGRGGTEAVRQAFGVAEKAKARALVDLLTGAPGLAPKHPEDPGLEARLGALQVDLDATYNRILGLDEDGHEVPIPDLQGRAVELEREISRLRLHASPTSDPFATAADTPADNTSERLPPDVTLVAYHVLGGEIVAFVGAGGGLEVARDLGPVGTVSELSQRLEIQWDRFRAGGRFTDRHAATLERSARGLLGRLYDALVAPLEPLLEAAGARAPSHAARRLVVVPHGVLHRVPFHALFDGKGYLIERFEFSYAPSARVYALCQGREARKPQTALIAGVADALIPAVAEEVRSVARHFPRARVLRDEEATRSALTDRCSESDVLHLACHGLFRSDNPMFSSLKLHDGWLTAAEAMRLDLDGALVTLSACESGRSEVAGDETIGLARAFLGAGAATLVTSLWLVQDETTADLMDEYYGRLRGGAAPAEALRTAQLALKRRYPHPHYWAPFVLVGRG